MARTMRSLPTGRVEVPFSARFHLVRPGRHPGGTPVGRLRMSRDGESSESFAHTPVMAAEIVEAFRVCPEGTLLDATVGGGGHSAAILDAAPQLKVVGIDQDPSAVDAASRRLRPFGDRAVVVPARFDTLGAVLESLGVSGLSGALFDLGVSSPQFDRAERGFSYRTDAPLDMRMDPSRPGTAADIVNSWPEAALVKLFRQHGESRFAGRIARALVAHRPLTRTVQLADVVRDAIPAPARRQGGHPARRVFQALRVAVNEEIDILPGALDAAIDRLVPGGRIAVLSYHSGEDRLVKARFRAAETGGCVCPPGLPCVCGAEAKVKVLTRGARKPTAAELEANRRSQSARLRVAEAVAAPKEEWR